MKKLMAIFGLVLGAFTVFSVGAFGVSWMFMVMDDGYHVALGSVAFVGFMGLAACCGFLGQWIDENLK